MHGNLLPLNCTFRDIWGKRPCSLWQCSQQLPMQVPNEACFIAVSMLDGQLPLLASLLMSGHCLFRRAAFHSIMLACSSLYGRLARCLIRKDS